MIETLLRDIFIFLKMDLTDFTHPTAEIKKCHFLSSLFNSYNYTYVRKIMLVYVFDNNLYNTVENISNSFIHLWMYIR